MGRQSGNKVKVQQLNHSQRGDGSKFVFIPIPLANAFGLQKGDVLEWKIHKEGLLLTKN